ncbi:MAG TPA: ferric reductase-like transmembrane domain-containing protein [Streptosporangiaceae bacterium]|nr:ferric reductase-like transmembrane domain-containing protein [Streptosporangiaceae bacterium]
MISTAAILTARPGAIVVTSSTPLWYTTRATGLVALVLLTLSMALGLASSLRFQSQEWPRFVTLGLHRNVSLLALAFTVIHVLTTVLDNFVAIPLQDAFVPFIGTYRPLWVGFGAIGFDLMLALIITSLLRVRMTLRAWRLVHWGSYLCWPVAVLHGLGTGTDTPVRWVLLLTAACVLPIVALTVWRLAQAWPSRPVAAAAGIVMILATLIAGTAWLRSGPLAPHWSVRSGTKTAQAHKSARAGQAANGTSSTGQ